MFKQNIMLFTLSKQTTNIVVYLETDVVNKNLPCMWRSIVNKYKMKTHFYCWEPNKAACNKTRRQLIGQGKSQRDHLETCKF